MCDIEMNRNIFKHLKSIYRWAWPPTHPVPWGHRTSTTGSWTAAVTQWNYVDPWISPWTVPQGAAPWDLMGRCWGKNQPPSWRLREIGHSSWSNKVRVIEFFDLVSHDTVIIDLFFFSMEWIQIQFSSSI